eukprot:7838672-Karenia_brevis.AAC.1
MTVELENRLRRVERQMLRMILGSPRRNINTANEQQNDTSNDVKQCTGMQANENNPTSRQHIDNNIDEASNTSSGSD